EISVPGDGAGTKPVRIGCVATEFTRDCEPEVLEGFAYWQRRLREVGSEMVGFDSSFWDEAHAIYAPIQASEAAAIHTPATGGDFSLFERSIADRLAWGASLSAGEIVQARERHAAFRDRNDALLRQFDFLIAPVAPIPRLAAGADHSNARRAILRYTTPA